MTPETSSKLSRRDALKTIGTSAVLIGLGALSVRGGQPSAAGTPPPAAPSRNPTSQPFELPKLPYAYDALEPHIDARTMEIHHLKHHQAYITNANKALADYADLQIRTAEELLNNLGNVPEAVRTTVRNNVGGHVNHSFFWKVLSPGAGGAPTAQIASALATSFGSVEQFKMQFAEAATKRFGSGWAWLSAKKGALQIHSTANQDSPLSDGAVPLLGLDVWEHAYYLHYQNRRADYIAAFWKVVNWPQVNQNYLTSLA